MVAASPAAPHRLLPPALRTHRRAARAFAFCLHPIRTARHLACRTAIAACLPLLYAPACLPAGRRRRRRAAWGDGELKWRRRQVAAAGGSDSTSQAWDHCQFLVHHHCLVWVGITCPLWTHLFSCLLGVWSQDLTAYKFSYKRIQGSPAPPAHHLHHHLHHHHLYMAAK